MYEKVNTNLPENTLQKINLTNMSIILVIIVLIIIIFIILFRGYRRFSKSINNEGFDIPDNTNNPDYPNNVDIPNNINIPGGDSGIGIGSGSGSGNNTGKIPSNIDSSDIDKYKDKYKDEYDKYKEQYDTYKKQEESIKNMFDTFNKYKNTNIKDEFNNYVNKYSETIKNEMSSIFDNETKKIKNTFSITIPLIKNPELANSLIVLSFIFIILLLCIIFIPSFKELKTLFNQISNVTYLILYTIFLILFLRLLPDDTLNKNAYYITPITLIIAVFLFIFSFRSNYINDYNLNYERIKMIIMFFCFVTICIVYYSIDPGGYISKNFGTSLLLTSLLGVFGLVYLITLLTLPETYDVFKKSKMTENVLNNVSTFSKYGSILFILFLIVITIVILTYPGGFLNNKKVSIIVIPLVLIVSILWSILLITKMFSNSNADKGNMLIETKVNLFKKALLTLLGFTISGLIIALLVYNIQHLSGSSGISSFILSILLVVSILILIYKTIFVRLPSNNANKNKNGFFDLITNLIFYIPCLFTGFFDSVTKNIISEYNSNNTTNFVIILIAIMILLLYMFLPKLQQHFYLQGGKQLVENPVYTNSLYSLGNYEQLNGSDNFDYQYGISFWIFLDANPPNTNSTYKQYTSLLNYGGKPNVLYKADTNSLMITMDQKELSEKGKNKLLEFDDNGNRIIYKNNSMLLQKWNNVIINYNGGTLDIFLNGELVKSSIEVVPYMIIDNLTIGSDEGVNGGICNVIYFKNPLTMINIYYLYNKFKNTSPPVINNSNKTIISLTN